ncbi:hypothetical protein PV327_002563 [Microctonus hyperodae]|uniref:Luciferin 4-monooxygenase n=1 Tax=Microctonus hyperodae TaxID=165561 RepID=A0AA39FFV0_MICHY|nr:hypothetical protein PV327_002563 [Microctonus hyperodae]
MNKGKYNGDEVGEKKAKSFVIEDGILKGEEDEFLENGKNNYGEVLMEQMKKNSKLIAQVDVTTEKEDTYDSIIDRSIRCALWLRNQNVGPNDVIAMCSHNHMNQVIPALASMYIGAILNPWWDYGLTPDLTKHFINLTKPKVLFINEECAKVAIEVAREMKYNLKIIIFGEMNGYESFDKIIGKPGPIEVKNFQCEKLSSVDHPAIILYTSGTTGMPKGALHSHKSMFGNIHNVMDNVKRNNALWYSTFCWVSGILCTFATIKVAGKRFIPGPFVEEDTCRIIEKYKINWILMGTSMANRLLKSGAIPRFDVSSINLITIGGAPLKEESQDLIRKAFPNSSVFQAYGTTELGGAATLQSKNYKVNSVGNLVKNSQLKIIDPETGKILGPNQKGEACFKSSFMMTEYYKNPEGTKKSIDDEGWLHTGDLAYYDEDGALFIIERLNELIKWRGHHVPPAVIEQLIQTLPGVAEVAVVPVPHSEDDEQPFAFIVKTPDSNVTEDIVHELVGKTLPDQMKLRAGIKFMDEIPHTASGKIGRRELKALAITMVQE